MSSFRPCNSAKLYASPEDMKTVGYRSLSLPSHSTRSQLRKSHSLRTSSGTRHLSHKFERPGLQVTNSNSGTLLVGQTSGVTSKGANICNQYAQPLKNSKSHSTIGIVREKKKKATIITNSTISNMFAIAVGK
jgi:SH3/ankyrin repeat-containing protein